MKVAIIGTVGVPANYGGFETLVENLLTYKVSEEIEYTIYCTTKAYDKRLDSYKGAKLVYLPIDANGMASFFYDSLSFYKALKTADVVLAMGTAGMYGLALLRLFNKTPVITNIDGLDDKRDKFSKIKQLAISKSRDLCIKHSQCIIADNDGIVDNLKSKYGIDSVLIEYGGDNAFPVDDDGSLESKYGLKKGTYNFKVARIEPENNISMILKAFSKMPNEILVIVGNWNRSQFGIDAKNKYSQYKNIKLLDPIYDQHQLNMLRSNCKLYIHGHSVGGTNPSLVEAMSLGLPIISYDVVYNRATTENQANYFNSVESLVEEVSKMTECERDRNIVAMKEIADRRYKWEIITQKYESLILKFNKTKK